MQYMSVAAALAANLAGVAPDVREEFVATADFLEDSKAELQDLSSEMALGMDGMPLVVHGADLTAPIARRWANQLNENTKQFAFAAEIPEVNHNLMEAWALGEGGFGGVFLLDRGQTLRERQRIELTAESVARTGASTFSVEARGETPSERLFWSVMLGDLISIRLAEQRGVDPLPVNEIVDSSGGGAE